MYLAAILSLSMDYKGSELLLVSEQLSKGALVGMIADICCALAASYFILRSGWNLRTSPLGCPCPGDLLHMAEAMKRSLVKLSSGLSG